MRRALVVGIDHYAHFKSLFGCVNDAQAMKRVLERHGNGLVNFGVKFITTPSPTSTVTRAKLREDIRLLFADDCEVALFYFAGHGFIETTGGYLLASDSRSGDEGVPLGDVLTYANQSAAKNKLIILDSCHSGAAGSPAKDPRIAELSEGLTILTASTADQYASEQNGSGIFTTLLVDALGGAAANLVGQITPGGVYAHIDQSLGPWEQRPLFKTNVKSFVSIREVPPAISLEELQLIIELFPSPGYEFPLDPSFEPERSASDTTTVAPKPENIRKFRILQKYNRVNLVVPVGAPHMWHAAMQSRSCKLTVLGEHYRRLAERGRI